MLSISTSVVVSLVFTVVIAIAGFLFKFLLARVVEGLKETLGYVKKSITELTTELKEINKKVDILSQHYAASSVREERNEQEINTLRLRQHEFSNDMAKTQGLLEKCKNCTKA